jgi:hypothetical protein
MAQAWPDAELHLVEQEGHGAGGSRTQDLILEGAGPLRFTALTASSEALRARARARRAKI